MGTGAQVFLGSAQLAAVTALLGELPTVAAYMEQVAKLEPRDREIREPLQHP
jgi:aconitate hydratase 2/2-methylisocitrate dehydratase